MNESYKSILKKTGITLIVIGFLDIVLMIYCIYTMHYYGSSFNIFALIGGILLYFRKSLKTARIVSFFSAFYLVGFIGIFIAAPLFIPLGFFLVVARNNILISLAAFTCFALLLVYLFWLNRSLESEIVKSAMSSQYKNGKSFWSKLLNNGYICGTILILALSILIPMTINNDLTKLAISNAKEEMGKDYKYFISSYSFLNEKTVIQVIYYDRESYDSLEFVFEPHE